MNRKPHAAPRITSAATVLAVLLSVCAPIAASADDSQTDTPTEALDAVAPEVLTNAAELVADANGAEAQTDSGTVNVPSKTDAPVQLSSNGVELEIYLPVSGASLVSDDRGAAVYSEVDGVSTVVSPQTDAGLVIATTLESSSAPTRFDYEYPGLTLRPTGEGDVVGYDASGEVAVFIGIPWAFDAAGATVETHYEVNGSTLTQVVEHTSQNFTYPIVADPTNYGGNDLFTQVVRDSDTRGTIIRVYPAAVNFAHISNSAIWDKYRRLTPSTYETTTMYD